MEHRTPPCQNTAVISIVTPGNYPAAFKDEDFNSVLRLSFDDLCEEHIKEPIGSIPDLDPDGPILWHSLQLPDANHARSIIDFLDGLTCENVVVHCHAGISRSAAVAQFIADKYNAALSEELGDTSFANKRVLRLLSKCNDNQTLQVGKYHPSGEMSTVGDQDDFDFSHNIR